MEKSADFNFYFGTMGSSKTANLLMKHHDCKNDNGMDVLLLTPSIDDRAGVGIIKSRTGMQAEAIIVSSDTNIIDLVCNRPNLPNMIMADEIQFFSGKQIEQLKLLTDVKRIPVDVYGLKLNFKGELFGGLDGAVVTALKLANSIEIKSFCACGNHATHVARFDINDYIIQREGPEILIGGNENYVPLCYRCWSSDEIPLSSRVRILKSLFEEETKKGKNLDIKVLNNLKSRIDLVEEKLLEEEINYLKTETKNVQDKIKKLTNQRNKNEKQS